MLAEHSGFCFGVRRAIQMALDAKTESNTVCTLGELIHNPTIVNELQEKGIGVCAAAEDIHAKTVVIRSHGISKQELEKLLASDNQIVDATCPYVKRAQELVASMSENPVFILGDPEHPEVTGMLSYGNDRTQVVQADTPLGTQNWKSLSVISQTTQKLSNLQKLVDRLLPRTLELRVFNTICSATRQRQESAIALAKKSDLMLVIGGKKSSNTRMLNDLCSAETRSIHVETESEVTPEVLGAAVNIGLAAGASTPEETIVKVFNTIKKINREAGTATCIEDLPLFKEESC